MMEVIKLIPQEQLVQILVQQANMLIQQHNFAKNV